MKPHETIVKNLLLRAEVKAKTNWLQAINLLEKATDDYPRERAIYLTLGDIYARNRKFEQAISSYQQALTMDPKDEHLLFIIGNCYLSLSEYQMALVYYAQVGQNTPELNYNRALAYAYSGQHAESLSQLKNLLTIVKDNVNIYYFMVEELLRLQKYDEAMDCLNDVEKRFGVIRHQQILKAFVWNFKKIWLKSYSAFKAADDMEVITNPDHLQSYANAAWQIGQLEKAIEILKRAITINPYMSVLYEDLVRIYIQKGDYQQGKELIKKANIITKSSNPILLMLKDKISRLEVEAEINSVNHPDDNE
jgi:tetratricopeptide (TPR) repeat protein